MDLVVTDQRMAAQSILLIHVIVVSAKLLVHLNTVIVDEANAINLPDHKLIAS